MKERGHKLRDKRSGNDPYKPLGNLAEYDKGFAAGFSSALVGFLIALLLLR